MKKLIVLFAVFCLFLTGCVNAMAESIESPLPADTVADTVITTATEVPQTIMPLSDTTMEELNDAILSVSLKEGGAYVDDTGKMQMDLKIFSYDKYDMVDIANLKVGDTIFRHTGDVTVTDIQRNDAGTILINGGLEAGGLDLVTDEDGIFYEMGYNDHKNWYEVGNATIRVSVDFEGVDSADLELGDVILYPGSFLVGEVTNYDFTPYNTTIRVEDGQIVEMNRRYIP